MSWELSGCRESIAGQARKEFRVHSAFFGAASAEQIVWYCSGKRNVFPGRIFRSVRERPIPTEGRRFPKPFRGSLSGSDFFRPRGAREPESVPEWEGGREREDRNRKPEKSGIRIRSPDMKRGSFAPPLCVMFRIPRNRKLILLRDSQGLARVNLVRILQHGPVGFKDGGVFGTVPLAVLAFGDLPESVSLLNGVEH